MKTRAFQVLSRRKVHQAANGAGVSHRVQRMAVVGGRAELGWCAHDPSRLHSGRAHLGRSGQRARDLDRLYLYGRV